MNFNLNKSDFSKLNKLLEINEMNYNIGEMYQYYFQTLARKITLKDIKTQMKLNNLSEEEAYFFLLMSLLEVDISDEESLELAKKYCLSGLKKKDINEYINNPYLKNIKFDKNKLKNIRIEFDEYLPYEGFPSDDLIVDEENYFQEKYQLGYFTNKFSFQTITHNNITWMSIIPNEIETMKDAINLVKGDVLVYGLGLGYFPYMISLKEDVNKITIIEKDPNIVSLFKKVILPQFKNQNKINIIQEDAFTYEKNSKDKYDYSFVDLYHGDFDGIKIYTQFKKLELRSSNYIYWLEKTLINVIRRNLITIIYEQVNKISCNYNESKDFNDKLINALYKQIKNKTFSSYQEIHNLLKEESIKSLIKQIETI